MYLQEISSDVLFLMRGANIAACRPSMSCCQQFGIQMRHAIVPGSSSVRPSWLNLANLKPTLPFPTRKKITGCFDGQGCTGPLAPRLYRSE